MVLIDIAGDGTVRGAQMQRDEIKSASLVTCLFKQIKTWSFPPLRDPVQVSWPFVFRPAAEPEKLRGNS